LYFFLFFVHANGQVDWSTKPLLQRTGPNLIKNSSFNGAAGWQLDGAVYEESVSRGRGSGSIRLHHALVNGDWNHVNWIRTEKPIKIEPGTQAGKILRLRGKGIRDINGYGTGDQLIHVNIWTPKHLSSEERRILEKLRESPNFKPKPGKNDKSFFDRMREFF